MTSVSTWMFGVAGGRSVPLRIGQRRGQRTRLVNGLGLPVQAGDHHVQGAAGGSSTAARATISGRCREESRYWCTVRMGQRQRTATPTWTRTWPGRSAAGVAAPATALRRRHACRAAQRAGAPGPSPLCPRPPAGQRCLAGCPAGWTGAHGRAHARHHQAPPPVPGHRPQVGRVVDAWYQRTSSSVASCSQAVSLQAITVGGAEHRIGLTQRRMLGGQEVRGDAGVQLVDDAGKGSRIADAVMP
jgi:hypothetical protein